MPELVPTLMERRVPHTLAIYAGASWALVEFVAFAVDEFLLSPHLTRVVLAALLMLLPTVFMLAWFHGKPGRDREEMARTEKIGIPANLLLCAVALWVLFGGMDLGAVTTSIMVETEDGETVEREVPKPEFRKRTVIFRLDAGAGLGEEETWTTYAVPLAIEIDLTADDFFVPIPFHTLSWRLQDLGYPDLRGVPLSLKREVARERFVEFLAVGEIDKVDDRYRVTLAVHETANGSVAGESVHEGTDLLALVDEMSAAVKIALGIPAREGIEDLPIRQQLTEDAAALEEFVSAMMKVDLEWDVEAGIDHLMAATTLDPTFTAAYRELSGWLMREDRPAEALAAIQVAMANLHRLPERGRFQVRTEYYLLTEEADKVAAILEMWLELYPEDLDALHGKWRLQVLQGEREEALATLTEMYRLNPGNGSLLTRLAGVREQLGRYEEAAAALEEYVDRFPDDGYGLSLLAGFRRRRGEHDAARVNLEKAILLHPLSRGLAWELAALDLETGRFDDARGGYERARDRARTPGERAEALTGLKRYHHFRGELGDAIRTANAWFDEVSSFMNPVALAHIRFEDIFLYLDAGRVSEAAGLLEEVEASDPGTMEYLGPRGRIHVALESLGIEAALEAHRHALEVMEANEFEELRPLLMADLGMIQERAGDYAAAAGSYGAALELETELDRYGVRRYQANFHLGAGRTLRKTGRLDESEAALREVLFRIPAEPNAHLELALVLEAKGDAAGAVEHLERALAAWENADEDYGPAQQARAKLEELAG